MNHWCLRRLNEIFRGDRVDPDYDKIVELCRREMEVKFPSYGNDWIEQDDVYYKTRLLKEVKEYNEAMTIEAERRKLINIVNIACMAHQTAAANRGCRQHEAAWDDIMLSKGRKIRVLCIKCHSEIIINNGIIREVDSKID